MKININVSEMRDLLMKQNNSFTPKGAYVMASWLNGFMGEDDIFDAVQISCDWKEYSSAIEFAEEYFDDYKKEFFIKPEDTIEDVNDIVLRWLEKRTIVITFDGRIIVNQIKE